MKCVDSADPEFSAILMNCSAPMANAVDEEIRSTYSELGAPIVIYGHIHVSYVRTQYGLTVANAGSVSQSYDGDRRAAYAVIDGTNVTIRRVEYGVESEAEELLRSGLPHAEWLSRILLADKRYRLLTRSALEGSNGNG